MTVNDQVSLAAKLMDVTEEEVRRDSGRIPDSEVLYFSMPQKGGGALMVDADGSVQPQDLMRTGRRFSRENGRPWIFLIECGKWERQSG